MFIHDCLGVNSAGHLTIGGCDTIELAAEFGTPAYIMDEATIRARCTAYRNTLLECFGECSMAHYAGKALSMRRIYEIVGEEGLGIDVVSSGELYTALAAGFPVERICFHGNNKTDADIEYAVKNRVGRFAADNREELDAISRIAGKAGITQKIILRITPGIDPHTHKAITTGDIDSKFGSPIATGQAEEIVKYAISLPNIALCGLHCHIGSQIFDVQPFAGAARIMLKFIADMEAKTGWLADELDLGGGFGVRYVKGDKGIDIASAIRELAGVINAECTELGIQRPRIMLEPGRSIVADAGITLYTVGSVKTIPGFRTYVSVDGGMPDNPRYALYQSRYEAVIANRAAEPKTIHCTIAGRCCESGDLIGENMPLQETSRGDILAVLVTGAYNYSMASNYNRLTRPPIIMVKDGKPYTAVRRESFEDLIRNDL